MVKFIKQFCEFFRLMPSWISKAHYIMPPENELEGGTPNFVPTELFSEYRIFIIGTIASMALKTSVWAACPWTCVNVLFGQVSQGSRETKPVLCRNAEIFEFLTPDPKSAGIFGRYTRGHSQLMSADISIFKIFFPPSPPQRKCPQKMSTPQLMSAN